MNEKRRIIEPILWIERPTSAIMGLVHFGLIIGINTSSSQTELVQSWGLGNSSPISGHIKSETIRFELEDPDLI